MSNRNRITSDAVNNMYNVPTEQWNSFSPEQRDFYNDLRTRRDDIVQQMNIPNDCLTNVNNALDKFTLEITTTLERYIPEHS